MLFNIFLNDLFYHIKDVNLHAYADDEQLYDSDVDPRALEQRILQQLQTANQWYTENGMIVNPEKYRAMVLGTTDHKFSFPVEDSLDLLGMTIDNQYRFRNLICTATKLKLYNAFILPHLQYCSTVWHFCSPRNCDKLESLNKRALRIVFNDKVSSYQQLLHKSEGSTLYNRLIQNMLITIYKCLNCNSFPKYLKNMFTLRQSEYSFRRTNILSLCEPVTSTYGLNSFRYFASKNWNSLPNNVRSESTLSGFRSNISKTSASVSLGFPNTRKLMKALGLRPRAFIVFECLETPMKHEARVFEITSPTKEN